MIKTHVMCASACCSSRSWSRTLRRAEPVRFAAAPAAGVSAASRLLDAVTDAIKVHGGRRRDPAWPTDPVRAKRLVGVLPDGLALTGRLAFRRGAEPVRVRPSASQPLLDSGSVGLH